MSVSACGSTCACNGRQQIKASAGITKGFIDAFDTPETYRLQGGCCVVVFIFLQNVRVVAPPPLESEGSETEKLLGGCSPTPCSTEY